MKYGLFNRKKISYKELKKIEKLVLKSNIHFIDTQRVTEQAKKLLEKVN